MPRRDKSPPPPDNEPKYLVVVHPYPLNANLDIPADRRALALWLACCTGQKYLLAMFHKPSSPGMVIIEVDCEFKRFDDLLGKHYWSKMLVNLDSDEEDKSSEVFYCNLETGRDVEKKSWKRIWVEEHWFTGWRPDNTRFKYPYPKTTYCDVPPESKTGEPLCRPLSQNGVSPKPIVGSMERITPAGNGNTLPGTSTSTSSSKGRGTDDVVSTSSNSRDARSPPPPPAESAVQVVSPTRDNYRTNQDTRRRGVPPTGPLLSSAAIRSSALSATSAPAVPPGLPPLPLPPPRALVPLPDPPQTPNLSPPRVPVPSPRQPSSVPLPPRAPVPLPRQPSPDLPRPPSHSLPLGPSPASGPPPPPLGIQSPQSPLVLGLTQPTPQIGEYEHFSWSEAIELEEDADDSQIYPDYAEGDKRGYSTLLVDCAPRVSSNTSRDFSTSRKSALDEDQKTSRDQSLPLMNGSERGRSSSSNSNSSSSTSNDSDNNRADDSSASTLDECEGTTSPDTPSSPPLDEKRGRRRDRGSSHRGANAPTAARATKAKNTVSCGNGTVSSVQPPDLSANDTLNTMHGCKPIPPEVVLAQGGFPIYDDDWGDPIAASQKRFAAEKAEKAAAKAERRKNRQKERGSEGKGSRGRCRNRGGENSAVVDSDTDSESSAASAGATGAASAASGLSGGISSRQLPPIQLTVGVAECPQDKPERWAEEDVEW